MRNDNIIETKSVDFAVRIVKLNQYLATEKKSMCFQSNCYEAVQASVQI